MRSLLFVLVFSLFSLPIYSQEVSDKKRDVKAAIERERSADEDPLARQQLEKTETTEEEAASDFELYGSARFRYRYVDGGDSVWEDIGSRLGVNGWQKIADSRWLFARYELGFNLLDELGFDQQQYQPDQEFGRTFFTRLAYFGYQSDETIVAYGKNWSTFYQVAAFTDRFDSMGGEAVGAYNAFTDGGASGTGRADNVLQARLNFGELRDYNRQKPLAVNLQVQHGEPVPGIENGHYGLGYGLSSIVEVRENFNLGFAWNHAEIDLDTIIPTQRNGISGNMNVMLLGARWFDEHWYIGATVSKSSNLQTTDKRVYFDGVGLELYGQYQLIANVWALAGLNRLEPDEDQ